MKKLAVIITAVLFMAGYTASAQMMGQGIQQHQNMMGQNSGTVHNRMHNRAYGGMMNGWMQNGNYGAMMSNGMVGHMMNSGMGIMQNDNCPGYGYGQMMNFNTSVNSVDNSYILINSLPNLQQQLSLDNNQVEKLLSLQTNFKKQQIDFQAELGKEQLKLNGLLQETAPANQVKKQLETIAETRIDQRTTAYETASKMKALLTNDQIEKLKNNFGRNNLANGEWMQQCQNGFADDQLDG